MWQKFLSWEPAWKLALVLAVVGVLAAVGASGRQPDRAPIDALGIALLILAPAGLVLRRRWPVPVMFWTAGVALVYLLLTYPYGFIIIPPIVAAFETIRQRYRLAAWSAMIFLVGGHWLFGWLLGTRDAPASTDVLIVGGWALVILIAAEVLRVRDDWVRENRRRKEAEDLGKVSEERLRIARELHDVVAHNISLINVQAGVALHLMDKQPEQARTALTAIKGASKEALVELRSVLGVLRQVDHGEPRHPTPGLARLDELVERTKLAGLDVRVRSEGERVPLPPGVDVAAYRIIQEALTNVLKHSGASGATVRLRFTPDLFTVEVSDAGQGADLDAIANGGSGLKGMRERVSALSGELTVGQAPGGGFRVRAEIPLED
ncbi:sensor histidine kinase [Flindersiella endophytica]